MRTYPSVVISACLLLSATVGCLGPSIREGQTAYVYVTGSGIISFAGESVLLPDLANTLKKAGAKPQTPIRIIGQGDVSNRILKTIAAALNFNGLRHVYILDDERRPVVLLDGKPVTGEPVPLPSVDPEP